MESNQHPSSWWPASQNHSALRTARRRSRRSVANAVALSYLKGKDPKKPSDDNIIACLFTRVLFRLVSSHFLLVGYIHHLTQADTQLFQAILRSKYKNNICSGVSTIHSIFTYNKKSKQLSYEYEFTSVCQYLHFSPPFFWESGR